MTTPRTELLTPRLAAIAASIGRGRRVADVGSDHGQLALWLARSGRVAYCLATEKTPALLARVARPPASAPWAVLLAYRAGDGFAALNAADAVDTAVLAGLGGRSIVRILAARHAAATALTRLVLQPRSEEPTVRRWLSSHGWRPVAERLTPERGRTYLTIAAERGDDAGLYTHDVLSRADLLAAGPVLIRTRPPELKRLWSAHRSRLAAIVARGGLGASARVSADLARAERVLAAISRRAG